MKYKDYYAILGAKRDASADDIKTAYRRLARKYHPDVSKEKDAEEKFKEMAEAYETLQDPEKRGAYDQLGSHAPGQEFHPPPDWGQRFAQGQGGLDDIDLSSLFSRARRAPRRRGAHHARRTMAGSDYEAVVRLVRAGVPRHRSGLNVAVLEWDPEGGVRRVPHHVKTAFRARAALTAKAASQGKGGKGANGGPTVTSISISKWPRIPYIA
jgi:curved DNA-binding protein